MKRSETPKDLLEAREKYLDARWEQLSNTEVSVAEEAIKYLLFVNAAGMAGSLGFIGAMAHLRAVWWPSAVLFSFATGVIIVGVFHGARYHFVERLFEGWRADVQRYRNNVADWNETLDSDESRVKAWWTRVLVGLAYAAFFCIIAGFAIAAWNFNQIAPPHSQGTSHERAEKTIPVPGQNTTGPRTPAPVGAGPRTPNIPEPPGAR